MEIQVFRALEIDPKYDRPDATIAKITITAQEAVDGTRLKDARNTYATDVNEVRAGIFETLSQFMSVEVTIDEKDAFLEDKTYQIIDINVQELPASVVESFTLYDIAYIAMSHSSFRRPTKATFYMDLDDALVAMAHQPGE